MENEQDIPLGQEELNPQTDSEYDISNLEKTLLDNASDEADGDDENLMRSQLDDVDEEGTPLNVEDPLMGTDLDVPGAAQDDANEAIGSEDEENNYYSDADTE